MHNVVYDGAYGGPDWGDIALFSEHNSDKTSLHPDFDIKSLIDSCFSESLINFDKIWHTYVLNKNETFETPSTKIG